MDTQSSILQITCFAKGSFPVKYLGVPQSPRKWRAADCHGLVYKITKRINCWAMRHLSYAGRVQLIDSVLFSLHTYWCSLFILPKKIITQIEDICRNFLWHQTASRHNSPQVAWANVCKPKVAGGLGHKNSSIWNTAAVGKHV